MKNKCNTTLGFNCFNYTVLLFFMMIHFLFASDAIPFQYFHLHHFQVFYLQIKNLKLAAVFKAWQKGWHIFIVGISWFCGGFLIPHKRTKLQRSKTCGSDGLYEQSWVGLQSIIKIVELQFILLYTYIFERLSDHNRLNEQYSLWTLEWNFLWLHPFWQRHILLPWSLIITIVLQH